jgi:hypothetical protein
MGDFDLQAKLEHAEYAADEARAGELDRIRATLKVATIAAINSFLDDESNHPLSQEDSVTHVAHDVERRILEVLDA